MAIAINSQKDNSPLWAVIILIVIMIIIGILTNSCKPAKPNVLQTYVVSTDNYHDTVYAMRSSYDPIGRNLILRNNDSLVVCYHISKQESFRIYTIK